MWFYTYLKMFKWFFYVTVYFFFSNQPYPILLNSHISKRMICYLMLHEIHVISVVSWTLPLYAVRCCTIQLKFCTSLLCTNVHLHCWSHPIPYCSMLHTSNSMRIAVIYNLIFDVVSICSKPTFGSIWLYAMLFQTCSDLIYLHPINILW